MFRYTSFQTYYTQFQISVRYYCTQGCVTVVLDPRCLHLALHVPNIGVRPPVFDSKDLSLKIYNNFPLINHSKGPMKP